MKEVKVQYAKTHLSALLAAVARGEEIVIARGKQPVARLVSVDKQPGRDLGFGASTVPDYFDEPLPGGGLAAGGGGAGGRLWALAHSYGGWRERADHG